MRILHYWKAIVVTSILTTAGQILLISTLHALSARHGEVAKLPIQDVRFGQRTVLVSDPNRHTLTLTPGTGEVDVCAPHEHGKSCRPATTVIEWLLRDAPE